jgi:hypothetical protein
MYKSFIFLILALVIACENGSECSVYTIDETNNINPFLENAGFIELKKDVIVFSNSEDSVTFSVISSYDKLLINTETQKWLFEVGHQDESKMIFTELYSKTPLIMKFSKIN